MIPISYEDIHDWEDLVLEFNDRTVFGGRFTSMRIDRDSIPKGLYAYDLRSSDEDDSWICQVKEYVMVNHFGTFVTPKQIPGGKEGRIVYDYSFDCTEEEYE